MYLEFIYSYQSLVYTLRANWGLMSLWWGVQWEMGLQDSSWETPGHFGEEGDRVAISR